MMRERNLNVGTLDHIANPSEVIHVRFAGPSFDLPLVELDLSPGDPRLSDSEAEVGVKGELKEPKTGGAG